MPQVQPAAFEINEGKQEQSSTYCYVIHWNPSSGSGHREYWTQFDKPVVIEDCPAAIGAGTRTFTPTQVNHGRIENSAEFTAKSTAVSIVASNDLRLFFVTAAANRVMMRIFRVNTAQLTIEGGTIDFDNHVFEVNSGILDSVAIAGNIITGTVIPEPYYMNRIVPRYAFQRQCNHRLYDGFTCGAIKGNFRMDSEIVSFTRSSRTVRIDGQHGGDAPLSFAGGYLRHIASDLRFGVIKQEESGGDTFLRLNYWSSVLENIGDLVDVLRGCRHTLNDCEAFGRKASFGGFPFIPNKNPNIHGV